MKKVLKIFGAVILCSGVIALIVCMCAIPNETKLFFDSVFEYLDKPFVLCGVSVTLGGILLYFISRYILSNTSVGKKHLKVLEEELKEQKTTNDKVKIELATLIENNYNHFDDVENQVRNYCYKLEQAIKLIPNKKVQEALNNGEETKYN